MSECKHDDSEVCEECCEHGDLECLHCIYCGKNMTEDKMAAAYDYYKARKYGD